MHTVVESEVETQSKAPKTVLKQRMVKAKSKSLRLLTNVEGLNEMPSAKPMVQSFELAKYCSVVGAVSHCLAASKCGEVKTFDKDFCGK